MGERWQGTTPLRRINQRFVPAELNGTIHPPMSVSGKGADKKLLVKNARYPGGFL
jgi:hypothetical protein